MTYASLTEIKQGIHFDGSEFYDINPDNKFDDLLTQLEERSRALINNQIGGETLEEETGRVDEVRAPDRDTVDLAWPVDSVSKVEVYISDSYTELDADRYHVTERGVTLDGTVRRGYTERLFNRAINPLKIHSGEVVWSDLGHKIQVTYDRGYSTIPWDVKEIQISMINRMLTHLRQDQNLAAMDPAEAANAVNQRQILTDDLKNRVSKVTRPKNMYTVL